MLSGEGWQGWLEREKWGVIPEHHLVHDRCVSRHGLTWQARVFGDIYGLFCQRTRSKLSKCHAVDSYQYVSTSPSYYLVVNVSWKFYGFYGFGAICNKLCARPIILRAGNNCQMNAFVMSKVPLQHDRGVWRLHVYVFWADFGGKRGCVSPNVHSFLNLSLSFFATF